MERMRGKSLVHCSHNVALLMLRSFHQDGHAPEDFVRLINDEYERLNLS